MKTRSFGGGISVIVPEGFDLSRSRAKIPECMFPDRSTAASFHGCSETLDPQPLEQQDIEHCLTLLVRSLHHRAAVGAVAELRMELAEGEDALLLQEADGVSFWSRPAEYRTSTRKHLSGQAALPHRTALFHVDLDSLSRSGTKSSSLFRLFLFRLCSVKSHAVDIGISLPHLKSRIVFPAIDPDDFISEKLSRSMLSSRGIDLDEAHTACEPSNEDRSFIPGIESCISFAEPPETSEAMPPPSMAEPEFSPSLPPPTMAESEPSPPPPPSAARPETVTAYLHAEMDAEVVLNHAATLSVFVSREEIELQNGSVSKTGKGEFETGRKLIVELIVQSKFLMLGDETGRREIDLPDSENPVELLFNLNASEEGEGVILVLARQGQIPVVRLELKPSVVGAKPGASGKIRDARQAQEPPVLKKPLHQLWIREVKTENGLCYNYQIYSPELQIQQYTESVPFKGDRAAYIRDLYTFIEEKWVASGRNSNDFLQELRAFGADLFDQLIPLPLQELLWKHRNHFSGIQVISSEPFIPWELVHLKNPAKKGMPKQECFLGQLGITRWLMGAGKNGWPPDRITVRKDGCRYVIPDYHQTSFSLPAAAAEAGFLEKHFHATPVPAELQTVRDLIAEPGSFDLLHFACHGQSDQESIGHSALLLNGLAGRSPYEPERFSETLAASFSDLEAPDGNRPLITVNACQTGRSGYKLTGIGGFANAFLNGGAGAFIGALWSVGDAPARTFIETLYTALMDGSNLSEAAIKARKAARKAGDATWLAYVVYGHPHLVLRR